METASHCHAELFQELGVRENDISYSDGLPPLSLTGNGEYLCICLIPVAFLFWNNMGAGGEKKSIEYNRMR